MPPIPIATRVSIDRDELICSHLHLVHPIARKFQSRSSPAIEDLRGAGVLGLVAAADRERAKGYPKTPEHFTHYAMRCIRGAILDSLGRGQAGLPIVGVEPSAPDSSAGRCAFQEALAALPPMEREILLRRMEGYTRAEIGTAIQMSDWHIRDYETRAVGLLRRREGVGLCKAA